MKPVEPGTVGTHAFSGSYDPDSWEITHFPEQTFSVGCFEWISRSGGGVKRGKVKVRVKGRIDAKEHVYERAKVVCEQLDAGTYDGPKVLTVRPKL